MTTRPASDRGEPVPTFILSRRSACALLFNLREDVTERGSPVSGIVQGDVFDGLDGIDLLLRRIRLRSVEEFEITDREHGTRHVFINFWGR